MPDPNVIMELINKQSSQALDLINGQMFEFATTFGLPAPPTLPKFVVPTPPGGPAPMSFFGMRPRTKAEETIKTPYTGAKVEEIIA